MTTESVETVTTFQAHSEPNAISPESTVIAVADAQADTTSVEELDDFRSCGVRTGGII